MADQAAQSNVTGHQPTPMSPSHPPLPQLPPTNTGLHIHRANNITLFSICALWLTLAYLAAVGEVTSAERRAGGCFLKIKRRLCF
ncbi:Hypothetical predicted protein [Scomber scombrus]|uniref:Uncharacterized protein n=1 Tax=Scomber scombrus TaxID=13677 RepID=A0AAV1NS97_SCOSC